METKLCPGHNVMMQRFTKDGKEWYSHKTPTGSYCHGVPLTGSVPVVQSIPQPIPVPPQPVSNPVAPVVPQIVPLAPFDGRNASIEMQVALKCLTELGVAKLLDIVTYDALVAKLSKMAGLDEFKKEVPPEPAKPQPINKAVKK